MGLTQEGHMDVIEFERGKLDAGDPILSRELAEEIARTRIKNARVTPPFLHPGMKVQVHYLHCPHPINAYPPSDDRAKYAACSIVGELTASKLEEAIAALLAHAPTLSAMSLKE